MVDKEVSRTEDMSPDGQLTLIQQDDGDIIVSIRSAKRCGIQTWADVEFCIPGMGGGASPETHRALRDLMAAMRADNEGRKVPHDVPVEALGAVLDGVASHLSSNDVFMDHVYAVEEWLLRYKSNA